MTGNGKKWDLVCQIDPNSYHYCVPFKVDPSLSKLTIRAYFFQRAYDNNH